MKGLIRTLFTILLGLFLGVLIFLFGCLLFYLASTTHEHNVGVEDGKKGAITGIKQLSSDVKGRWFDRKHHDVFVYYNGPCVYFQYYSTPGALHFGQDRSSGQYGSVSMTEQELHHFADTLSTDTEQTLTMLLKLARTNPAPEHEM
ncbi:MAG TPA: hypothetical protein VGN64_16260 [Dyadobacter sp.]|jgi:hypothetical protein|nr:hypothetical protein [Dyadobacter sp.]